MNTTLPAPLARYFAAGERSALADLFAADAVVMDEGHVHRGRPAIAAWLLSTEQRYQPRYEIVDASPDGRRTVVTFKVSGTFAGSPLLLRQAVVTDGQEITSLETL